MRPCPFFLRGEIDVASSDGLLATLRSAAGRQLGVFTVDCMDLTYLVASTRPLEPAR